MQKVVLQLLADNNSGVLSRISGLFSRRGYTSASITAGVTADPKYSRITIVTCGDAEIIEQIEKQLNKKLDVIKVKTFTESQCVSRELMLMK
ncbi:MAG: acetolactate synthase small subunit, partial [Lachnospiraceae bacterium]|nr:acetolactate synthase small subunit [Lachnospiraceae bacterium]